MTKINKDEAAQLLGKSARAVERYAAQNRLTVSYERGTTRDVPVYDRAEVENLAEELKQPSTPTRPALALAHTRENAPSVMATHSDNSDNTRMSLLPPAEIVNLGERIIAALEANNAPSISLADKLMLNLKEAAALSGLSANHLREAIKTKKLKARIIGRGYKLKRDELEAYVKKL